ncbi:hypothetical protein AB0J14_08515 [Micromonospora arborensis]|uniref:hypothetical protein n=1 Tax=Micromonospora arborensis TaxID=2116518 RepID=UPI0033C6A207
MPVSDRRRTPGSGPDHRDESSEQLSPRGQGGDDAAGVSEVLIPVMPCLPRQDSHQTHTDSGPAVNATFRNAAIRYDRTNGDPNNIGALRDDNERGIATGWPPVDCCAMLKMPTSRTVSGAENANAAPTPVAC